MIMRLVIVDDQGQVWPVDDTIDSFDLDKPLARAHVIEEIQEVLAIIRRED